jgi:hypothetical protein
VALLLFGLTALLVPPLFAVPEPSAAELKANRAQLEEWKKDLEQLARLRRDLRTFLALSESRREQLVKFDADLQTEAAYGRLWNVLARYAEWLEGLSDADREAVRSAPDRTARLKIIRELRDQQWIRMQPLAERKKWAGLTADERGKRLLELREIARDGRARWQLAMRFWKELESGRPVPVRLTDLDPRDERGVVEYLSNTLTPAEKEQLARLEGKWPAYMQTLVANADRHPLALIGPYARFNKLPKDVRDRMVGSTKSLPAPVAISKYEMAPWPALARAVIEYNNAKNLGPLPNELWVQDSTGLLDPMKKYLKEVLGPALEPSEQGELRVAEGRWPDYPNKIQELAVKHLLPAPWQTALLAGPADRWDNYRTGNLADVAVVPRQALQDFYKNKLNDQQRANLKLSQNDIMRNWQILQAEFFKHMEPNEQRKYFGSDAKRPPFRPLFPMPHGHFGDRRD